MPIQNGKDISLSANPGTLPNVQDAMLDWFQSLTFTSIVKTVVNFNLVETRTSTTFQGVKQPFTAQQLVLKPEGQRNWKWFTVHAFPSLILAPDEVITFDDGVSYRVKEKLDYKEYGYVEYHLIQDYEAAS